MSRYYFKFIFKFIRKSALNKEHDEALLRAYKRLAHLLHQRLGVRFLSHALVFDGY